MAHRRPEKREKQLLSVRSAPVYSKKEEKRIAKKLQLVAWVPSEKKERPTRGEKIKERPHALPEKGEDGPRQTTWGKTKSFRSKGHKNSLPEYELTGDVQKAEAAEQPLLRG